MSNVTRICTQCGHGNIFQCGVTAPSVATIPRANLPAVSQVNLPALVGKAAMPVLICVAGLALSAGWKLLQRG